MMELLGCYMLLFLLLLAKVVRDNTDAMTKCSRRSHLFRYHSVHLLPSRCTRAITMLQSV